MKKVEPKSLMIRRMLFISAWVICILFVSALIVVGAGSYADVYAAETDEESGTQGGTQSETQSGSQSDTFTGIRRDDDGVYRLYVNGKWQKNATYIYQKTQYIKDGVWQKSFSGFYKSERDGKSYLIINGIFQKDATYIYQKKYYVKDGTWRSKFSGFYKSERDGKSYLIINGIFQKDATYIYKKTYYVKDGTWRNQFNGFYKSAKDGNSYLILGGIFQKDATYLYIKDGKYYYVRDGVWRYKFNGLYKSAYDGTSYVIKNGILDNKYSGAVYCADSKKYQHVLLGAVINSGSGSFKDNKVNNYTYEDGVVSGIASTPFGKHVYVQNGVPASEQILNVDGEYYKVGSGGNLISGWSTDAGKQRYYDPKTFQAVRDKTVDKLYVNENAEVTEASRLASKILDEIGWNLESAYAYCRDLEYERAYGDLSVQGTTALAEYTFTNKKGNCYRKSAAFWYLAKTIGYPNLLHMAGYAHIPTWSDDSRHGWCEAEEDGVKYVLDPTMEARGGWALYHVTYAYAKTEVECTYKNYHVVAVDK